MPNASLPLAVVVSICAPAPARTFNPTPRSLKPSAVVTRGAGLILHLVLIRVMPAGRGRPRQLITMGAWIGFVSTLVTLFPVIATSTCA